MLAAWARFWSMESAETFPDITAGTNMREVIRTPQTADLMGLRGRRVENMTPSG